VSPRQITVVASELLGRAGTGGAGTADSLLAVALGRRGHDVRLLIASGRDIAAISPEWTRHYESANVQIRVLARIAGVQPPYLAPTLEVFRALRDEPPEVVIADDWRGLAFAALKARQTAQGLSDTAFVIHCHGPGRVLTEFAQKVPDTIERFGEDVTERASIELADAVVSPTHWLLDWMRAHGWPVKDSAQVIPYVRQSVALGSEPEAIATGDRVRRLAFFGQLREGKGIRLLLGALESLDPGLLEGVELVFLGSARGRWTSDRVLAAIDPSLQERLAGIRFETELEREEAFADLRTPGTLALMPSLLDNSPNTVLECLEQGIPFLSTRTGGIPELVAPEDRARVLCSPTVADLAAALTTGLTSPTGVPPAHPAHEGQESVDRWTELIEAVAPARRRTGRPASHIAVVAQGEPSAVRARRLADSTQSAEVEVIVSASRRAGFDRTAADWIVFLDDDDEPDDGLLDAFVSAQAESDADAVTVAVRPADDTGAVQLFLGDPGALGLVENLYGVLAFVRSAVIAAQRMPDDASDPDWPVLARVALGGGRIVSLPEALSTHRGRPGRAGDVPGEGLTVLEAFENRPVAELQDLPQFAATLAAALMRPANASEDGHRDPVIQRLRRRFAQLARPSR
jgi:glycosyltransferase involved in cell wall biosynthesis